MKNCVKRYFEFKKYRNMTVSTLTFLLVTIANKCTASWNWADNVTDMTTMYLLVVPYRPPIPAIPVLIAVHFSYLSSIKRKKWRTTENRSASGKHIEKKGEIKENRRQIRLEFIHIVQHVIPSSTDSRREHLCFKMISWIICTELPQPWYNLNFLLYFKLKWHKENRGE
jgi:hypothetical protein